ncbi:Bcr/CflA family efflux MFS transporter [Roseibium denhamense]|uniref:Bcr/CflA family efflux transporter n=1 Tax=Roseibium denhamense TaxID=76305 RepID=A0ABY1NRW7_9HYPH|nr:multidrug effflux MFS transporter [Roseibium denhamense]MTI08125.1 Bcr/CflA family efflux MFS transporter [Roseibium denhamense]SMP16604.1 MFS transporter, DHA1 family, bicyclomycin/chloramphenicol resistance protein [Roseibium denhamense]
MALDDVRPSISGSKPSILVLIVVSSVTMAAMQIYLPSINGMLTEFSATANEFQWTLSAYLIAIAISQLIWGPLSDQFGRKPIIVLGMALFVLGTLMCVLATTVESLMIARVIQAAGGCTGLVLGRAMVRDIYGPAQSASMIGYLTMGVTVMPLVAPAIGGLLDPYFGWQGGFYLMLGLGFAALWASIVGLPETHFSRREAGPGEIIRSYVQLTRERLYWCYALTVGFSAFTFFAYLGGAPVVASQILSVSPAGLGGYMTFVALGYFGGNFLSGRYTQRFGMVPMILAGSGLGLFAIALVAAFTLAGALSPLTLFVPMAILGLGNGLCVPSGFAGAVSVRPDLAGAASGLTASLQMSLGAVAGTLVAAAFAGGLMQASAWAMLAVMALGMGLSLFFALLIRPVTARVSSIVAAE